MSLFLPILLLGLTQPADQPVTPPAAQPPAQAQNSAPAGSPNRQDTPSAPHSKRFDQIQIYPSATSDVCFTMRSYYFERRDALAPEPQGMSTCESGRDIAERNTKKDHDPRLVPLAAPGK